MKKYKIFKQKDQNKACRTIMKGIIENPSPQILILSLLLKYFFKYLSIIINLTYSLLPLR